MAEEEKTLTTKLTDGGQYYVPSAAIAAMLVLIINRLIATPFSVEETAIMTGGLVALINTLMIIAKVFYKRFL